MNPWKNVAEILKNGGVVIIPSDSSFGIAALAGNPDAVARVYKIKGREAGKPSLLIVGSIKQAQELVEFTPLATELAKKYWPGGLTMILEAKDLKLAPQIYGENNSLAVRFPDKKELRDLAINIGPFILPSANLAGLNPPYKAEEVHQKLIESVDFFLNEPADGNPPSTLVDVRGEKAIILRNGSVTIHRY